jgi:selenium metabolism protein YedF
MKWRGIAIMTTVNAMGNPCPIPIVKTKKAIEALNGKPGQIETLVDSEISAQNLLKMAEQKGYPAKQEKLGENRYHVIMDIPGEAPGGRSEAVECPAEPEPAKESSRGKTVVVISSKTMGNGSDELGETLMKSFIYALSQLDRLPDTILFYNGGVTYTTEGTPSLEDLRAMADQGVEILSCGTCLKYYGLSDKVVIGGVTNMYDIVERQSRASLIIRP